MEPPANINILPEDFIKTKAKFKKQAFKELLEACSKSFNQIQDVLDHKTYKAIFTLDGEAIESLDDFKEDTKIALLSVEKEFKGVINLREQRRDKELRFDNAEDVKKQIGNINRNWTDQQYQTWVQNASSRNLGQENVQLSMQHHSKNEYYMSNSQYRNKIKERLGRDGASVSPTFQGGGFANCDQFLLPTVTEPLFQRQLTLLSNILEGKEVAENPSPMSPDQSIHRMISFKESPHHQLMEMEKDGTTLAQLRTLKTISLQDQALMRKASQISISKSNKTTSERKTSKHQPKIQDQDHNKTLPYEECKQLSNEYLLPNKVIYELHSEFNSLIEICKQNAKSEALLGNIEPPSTKFGKIVGIPIDIFIATNPLLQEKHPEIAERLLFALNINTQSKNSRVTWTNFLQFSSLLKYFTVPKKSFIRFWMLVS